MQAWDSLALSRRPLAQLHDRCGALGWRPPKCKEESMAGARFQFFRGFGVAASNISKHLQPCVFQCNFGFTIGFFPISDYPELVED